MIATTKLVLFAVPMLLTAGVGVGVAYHDGVMADDVRDLSDARAGDEVMVKGRVAWADGHCDEADGTLDRNVSCFLLEDLEDEARKVFVTEDRAPPAEGEVVVVRGFLRFVVETSGGSGSTTWEGGCWSAGKYGSGCWDGGKASWSWPGFKFAWVDAGDVARPWIFR